MSLPSGTTLGPYEILGPLGAGGMGEVHHALDTRLGRKIAIKVLDADLAGDSQRLRRFEQEAAAASALNHPNILTIHDIGHEAGLAFIVMEWVRGRTLRDLLAEGPLPPRRAARIAHQIAEGLAQAHAAGIIHRDLKPENAMVSDGDHVKIVDFGLAKLKRHHSSADLQEPNRPRQPRASCLAPWATCRPNRQADTKRIIGPIRARACEWRWSWSIR